MTTPAYDRLGDFLQVRMRMSHIYQPLMLRTLLSNDGTAARRRIAEAFLAHDESQIEYYERITDAMPGRVLKRHGVVERQGDTYVLAPSVRDVTEKERAALLRLCDQKVEEYKARRGAALFAHRVEGMGRVPGGLRYEVLKRAGFHCELCGVSADERALEVDHVVPRKHGGRDEIENLQPLCWRCNGDKGAGDDTDFRAVRASFEQREPGCVFCGARKDLIAENTLAVAVPDRFPVTTGHALVIPRRHVADYFDLFASERRAVDRLVEIARSHIRSGDSTVAGFNVGTNSGEVAGQTVMHCHVHVIPRRRGDVPDPRGGVRHVIPGKANYLR
jgi:ATP adenylyltransferase